jgi:hypothetical protein
VFRVSRLSLSTLVDLLRTRYLQPDNTARPGRPEPERVPHPSRTRSLHLAETLADTILFEA